MCCFLFWLAVCFATGLHKGRGRQVGGRTLLEEKKEGLYSNLDDVIVLNKNNFVERVYGKSNVWIIEFYNSWCGHCIHFAPTWKQFASNIKGWRRVVSVGAIDCSDGMNLEICRDYNVQAYPSMKLFPPYTTREQTEKHMIKNVNTQNSVELRDAVLDYITDPELKPPNTWPRLQPLKSIADIWEEAQSEHKFVVLVFENEHSLVGRQVILDLVDYPTVLVRTMLKEDVEKFGIMTYPSLYSINKDSSFQLLASGTGQADSDRHRFVDTLLNLVGHINHEGKKMKIVHDEDKQVNDGVVHFQQEDNLAVSLPTNSSTFRFGVHMLDLESAFHYSFRQEVAICKTIEGQKLDSLRNFITTLAKFFPGRKEIVAFLWKLANHLAELQEPLTGESWLETVESIQDKNAFLPERVSWARCKGSQPGYRGYPCSMWTLFHVLTVSAYDSAEAVNPQEVLLSISGYMKHFFGCQECSQNFLKMAATVEDEVHKPRDAVIWLWNAHNRANKRLHGDISEDPQHPKVQFPLASDCPECHMMITPDSDQSPKWNTSAAFLFLVKFFSKDGIIQITLEEDTKTPVASLVRNGSSIEMDWWEKKQKDADLKRIKMFQLRKPKKQMVRGEKFDDNEKKYDSKGDNANPQQVKHEDQDFPGDPRYSDLSTKWGFSQIDIGVCMAFYVCCAVIILFLYYHFISRKRYRLPCSNCPPV